jgi:hypothetical protein
LAWAVAVDDSCSVCEVEEEDIKRLYLADPMTLGKHPFHIDDDTYNDVIAYSPAHMLCIRTNPSLSLIRFLVEHNPMAFNARCSSDITIYPLHLAAEYSESIELLQILFQLDKSVAKIMAGSHYEDQTPHTPLGILCGRKESTARMDMIQCLIEVDSSVKVVEDAIYNCLCTEYSHHSVEYRLKSIEMLLKANPEAALCANVDLIQEMCSYNEDQFMSLMSLFLAANKDILKKFDIC